MPTLGFLKKKKTKDSSGSHNSSDPSSPVATSTVSHSLDQAVSTSNETATGSTVAKEASGDAQKEESMQSNIVPQAQQSHLPASQNQQTQLQPQQNVPSIQNLVHPANGNGATDEKNANKNPAASSNGASETATSLNNVIPTQVPQQNQLRSTKGKYTLSDFAIQRTLGTGSFGRVHLVQSKHNQRFYAIKVLKKAQVVKMKQIEHTNDERRMLQKVRHPFLVTLWGTFQDSKNLYMVMDFVEGGELFSLLRKSQVSRLLSHMKIISLDWSVTADEELPNLAVPQPGREILCRRGYACARLSPYNEHHLSRSQTRKFAA